MTNEQLKDQCDAEFENIQAVLDELFTVVRPGKADYSVAEMAAIATFLHNDYNGIENVMKSILAHKNVELKNALTWHRDPLKAAAAQNIF